MPSSGDGDNCSASWNISNSKMFVFSGNSSCRWEVVSFKEQLFTKLKCAFLQFILFFHCGSTFQTHSVCFPTETNKCIWGCEYRGESAIYPDPDPFKLKLMFCCKTHNVSPSITVSPRYSEALPSVRFVKYGRNFAVLIKWHVAVHFYVGVTKTDGFCVRRRHRYFLPPLLSGTDSRFRLFCPWRVTGLYRTSSLCLHGKKKKKSEFTTADRFVPGGNSGWFKNADSLIDLSTLLFCCLSRSFVFIPSLFRHHYATAADTDGWWDPSPFHLKKHLFP